MSRLIQLDLLDPTGLRLGQTQSSYGLQMIPIFGASHTGFASPANLKLEGVRGGYGNVGLRNPTAGDGVAIVPLHLGYIQRGAQNHALCRSAFIAPGETVTFNDACCVQAAQGGYLEGRDQWFFILPLALRRQALELRGQNGYSKLWESITAVNERYGLKQRGHLEHLLVEQRGRLDRFRNRFELMPEQRGALFFLDRELVGVELGPNPEYFRDVWTPLVAFCYGTAAWARQQTQPLPVTKPFTARTLGELKSELEEVRTLREQQLQRSLVQRDPLKLIEEERYQDCVLRTALGRKFCGQLVERDGKLVYASLFHRSAG